MHAFIDAVSPRARPAGAAAFVARVLRLPATWRERRDLRRALARMSPHHRDDIGFDEAAAEREIAKPFWAA
ncbi:DUF1127 domain-containing protein [Azospirillum sp. ST 5-10]|uniref:DUF1127 domain-containing protein n=1 Tax=unclassified Azospirillum TaxID=2630922 RepID=UPI003F4A3EC6